MAGTRSTKTAIVAGGAGFLGSHVCEMLLTHGHRVLCIDNFVTGDRDNLRSVRNHPLFSLLSHDICEPLHLDAAIDMIFNLACAASPPHYQADPVHTMRTCVVGTLNLLELAEHCNARFLQASTSEVYGDPDLHPQNEEYTGSVNCTGPRACYDEGKRAAEAMCFDFIRSGRVDARVARIFNTYGPRMHPNDGRVVSNLIMQALRSEPLTIYGDGSQTRSFCYVSDLVDGLNRLMAAKPAPEGPINLGNPGEFTILELADLVLGMTGSTSSIRFLPLPADDPRRRRPDIARAIGFLRWRPKTRLRDGLAMTVEHFQKIADAVDKSPTSRMKPGYSNGLAVPGTL